MTERRRRITASCVAGAALLLVIVSPGVAEASVGASRAVCGPPGAHTVLANRQSRVYVRLRGDQHAVFGCHRSRRRAVFLGERTRVQLVRLAGRFTAVVRTDRDAASQKLAVVDLRRGRNSRSVGSRRDGQNGRFVAVSLDRTGVAAYTLQLAPVDEFPARVEVGSTAEGQYASAPDIEPSVLGLAGTSVAFVQAGTVRLRALDEVQVADGRLLRVGDVQFTTARRRGGSDRLFGRLDRAGRPVLLGEPVSPCLGSSGCSGVDALQVAGRFVAVRDGYYHAGLSGGAIRVYDLRNRRSRTTCRPSGLSAAVAAFVLTETGAIACAVVSEYSDRATYEIRSEGVVLDRGGGVDLDSLARRGTQLVWLHDGSERTAPLPVR